jgi:protein-tyrosine phosphatase
MHRLFDLRQRGLLTVIAHPERYRCIWRSPEILERLVDSGAAALLDAAALVGKYGREPKRAAEELLERGLYHAACSDAHRTTDVAEVEKGMRVIAEKYGAGEVEFLFGEGPKAILAGERAE